MKTGKKRDVVQELKTIRYLILDRFPVKEIGTIDRALVLLDELIEQESSHFMPFEEMTDYAYLADYGKAYLKWRGQSEAWPVSKKWMSEHLVNVADSAKGANLGMNTYGKEWALFSERPTNKDLKDLGWE